jgi:glycosyltransferase involved in cell wall biosynthesis
MRLALVADHILTRAGSERVFQYLCEEFPEADVFTSVYALDKTWEYFRQRPIRATSLNLVVRTHKAFQYAFPVATHLMEEIDFSGYDAVFSLSATIAKYVRAPRGRHICYCLVPTRALWNAEGYFRAGIKKTVVKAMLGHLRRRDYAAAQRVNRFLCISEHSRRLIEKHYDQPAKVIHSPIDLDRFRASAAKQGHYLLVSRLECWKKLEYALEAFNRTGLPLRVIGTGIDEAYLKTVAGPNIKFLGSVPDEVLVEEYSRAAAVIFTPELEYGLIPLEASASGTPVICYGRGGVVETMIPWNRETAAAGTATAIFFDEQTPEALIEAVQRFERCRADFHAESLRRHAEGWGIPEFKRRIREELERFLNGEPAGSPQMS